MPRSVRFDNGKALVPLGLIAERWIRDYWQLASGPRMPRQIHQNRELGFGTALERTMTKCHSQYGVFESLMRNEARSKDQTSLLQLLFDDVVTTALKGPIHYIQDDGRNPVFTYVATHELAAMTPKSMSAWLLLQDADQSSNATVSSPFPPNSGSNSTASPPGSRTA